MDAVIKILLVEDSAVDAELVQLQLQRAGLKLDTQVVDSEREFLAALAAGTPDVILSDFSLPGFDGMTALGIAQEKCPDTPFVFYSGTIGEERGREAMSRGAADYIPKGRFLQLAPAVERALRHSQLRQARRISEQALREKEQRLRDIVETSQDWVWELDQDGRYVFSNRAVKDMLGFRPNELNGKSHLDFVHPEDHAQIGQSFERMKREGYGMTGIVGRWRAKNGEYRWLEKNVLPLFDLRAEFCGFRGTDRDITERKLQEQRLVRASRIEHMLSSAGSAIVRIRDREELLQEACRIAVEQGGYALATVVMREGNEPSARRVAWKGEAADCSMDPSPIEVVDPAGRGLVARAFVSGQPTVSNDLQTDPEHIPMRQDLLARGLRSAIALPLRVDAKVVGALVLNSQDPNTFNEPEVELLQQLASNISFALEYLQREETVRYLASYDPLTGLAKRSLFCERMGCILPNLADQSLPLVVLVFDLERLSTINASFGRVVGDKLLQLVAERMRTVLGDTRSMAHLGGGAFAVVFTDLVDDQDAAYILRNEVSRLFSEPFVVNGQSMRMSAKSGISHYPLDGADAETLLQRAEAALRRAKESGEKYLHYKLQMNTQVMELMALENRLQLALTDNQFELYYQPTVSLSSGRIESAEALIRWHDPELGLVAPGRFIPILESTGMILEVGQWALKAAAAQALKWRLQDLPKLRIAVNVSPLQLKHREFASQVLGVLARGTARSVDLDIEITESMLMSELESSVKKLHRLRAAGVRIALDDFGTGFSSLSRLAKLPIDILKIDRSFVNEIVADESARAIVSTVISLAHAFNMKAVAEGVESRQQLELLRELGCDQVQGYLISQPVPAARFESMLTEDSARVQVLQN